MDYRPYADHSSPFLMRLATSVAVPLTAAACSAGPFHSYASLPASEAQRATSAFVQMAVRGCTSQNSSRQYLFALPFLVLPFAALSASSYSVHQVHAQLQKGWKDLCRDILRGLANRAEAEASPSSSSSSDEGSTTTGCSKRKASSSSCSCSSSTDHSDRTTRDRKPNRRAAKRPAVHRSTPQGEEATSFQVRGRFPLHEQPARPSPPTDQSQASPSAGPSVMKPPATASVSSQERSPFLPSSGRVSPTKDESQRPAVSSTSSTPESLQDDRTENDANFIRPTMLQEEFLRLLRLRNPRGW